MSGPRSGAADAISARILAAAGSALRGHVRPALANPDARNQLDLVIRLLAFVEARQSSLAAPLAGLVDAEAELLERAGPLIGETTAPAERFDVDHSLQALEDRRDAIESRLSAGMPALLALVDSGGETSREARDLLRALVAGQVALTLQQDPEAALGSKTIFGGGRLDDAEPEPEPVLFSENTLSAYLDQHFPGEQARARDVSIVAGGYSKRTVFLTIERSGHAPLDAVLRMDLPGPSDRSIVDEFPLLRLLADEGLPVPEPYWLERDDLHFGGRFMIGARRPGRPDPSALFADPARADAFGRSLAARMAQLHAIDVTKLDPAASAVSAATQMRRELTRYYDYYRLHRKAPQPVLDLAFSWLLANVPAELEDMAGSIVHTDLGFHNILLEDGNISAILDWETAHVGDPAEDLYYTKLFIDQIMDWDVFLDHYHRAGGKPCPPSSQRFYDVWRGARIAANCTRLRGAFEDDMPDATGFALVAYIFGRRLELEAGQLVASLL